MASPGPFRFWHKSECIAQHLISSTPPWLHCAPGFDYTLCNVGTKSNTSPDLYLSLNNKLVCENYEGCSNIFTDGLKQGISVAAAAESHDKVLIKTFLTMRPFSQPKQ
jgi:hypothetical protein